jgi:hypothetical protein
MGLGQRLDEGWMVRAEVREQELNAGILERVEKGARG